MDSPIVFEQGKTGIITCDEFSRAPDGDNYKYFFGPVYYAKAEEVMGFVPKGSANWFVVVGDIEEKSHGMRHVIAGCQVHYAHFVGDPSEVRTGAQNLLDLSL